MRTFQNGMRVAFIGDGNTSLHNQTGTVSDEGETVDVTYKHFSTCLNATDLILAKGQRVAYFSYPHLAGTVLEPHDIWQRAETLTDADDHTTPVLWDNGITGAEDTRVLRLSDIPAGAYLPATATDAAIDSWWDSTAASGVYEEDIIRLKTLIKALVNRTTP